MPVLIVFALIVVPLLELSVLIQVGGAIGVFPTIALLLLMSVLGASLLRREGARAWRSLGLALQQGRLPAREVADGALVILGGALLLTPGFVTDAVGLLCILPPSRAVLRQVLTGLAARRLGGVGIVGVVAADQFGRRAGRATDRAGEVVEGDVVEGEVLEGEGPPPSDRPARD